MNNLLPRDMNMLELLNIVSIDVNMKTLDKVVEVYWKFLQLRRDRQDHMKEQFAYQEDNDDINGGDVLTTHEIYDVWFTRLEV